MTFALIGAVTPGPSNVMISATGSAVGFVRGLPCALGAAIGMASLLFGAALGLGQIVVAQPMLLNTMNVAGSAFMLWLAWKIATAGPGSETQRARPVGLIGAAVFQWANPKGWLVAVSAAGTYLQATTDQLVQAVWLGSLFFVAALPSGLAWPRRADAGSPSRRTQGEGIQYCDGTYVGRVGGNDVSVMAARPHLRTSTNLPAIAAAAAIAGDTRCVRP